MNIFTLCLLCAGLSTINYVACIRDVCYSYLGCFSMELPWYSALRPLPAPQSPVEVDTQFFLYTRNQPDRFAVTKLPNISFSGSDYDGARPTFFLVQGYVSNSNMLWVLAMKDALLKQEDANVVVLDWSKGSTRINYLQVASNARVVGAELTRFAKFLVSDMKADVSRFHIIGHSIGAHIAGYVGKDIPGIARITALEAAQPGFEGYPALVRLDPADAIFVEAIHTDARPFIPTLGFGYMAPIGHVDFYVNGGCFQPGCLSPPSPRISIMSLEDLGKVTVDVLMRWIFCSHARSFYIFTEAVNNTQCTFWGHKADFMEMSMSILSGGYLTRVMDLGNCTTDSCTPLGMSTPKYPARGVFLVKTTSEDPFCIAEPEADANMVPVKINEIATE